MPLSAGDKLGPYEILAPLGAGGMGEVYKARDTRLERIVAVKVSREEFTKRFEREARVVAALNHPHICQLYDVGPDYLVMEYIEGSPLKGPLPLHKALEYAGQIASALDAAHSNAVTHRDLKPANILMTRSAGVKLLDFGLAKIEKPVTVDDGTTLNMELTAKGTILGTLLYMSPEQINGSEAGPRSDIFSFGVVLYEMITGKRAFEGATPASVIGAILERPAPSIADVAPPALDRLLKRCLEKDPEDRWQTARDLRAALELVGQTVPPSVAPAPPRSRLVWLVAAVAALALGALAFLLLRESPPPESRSVRFQIPAPEKAGFDYFKLSPDGRLLAFTSGGRLWIRPLDSLQSLPLPDTAGADKMFWSHDSRFLAFFAQGKLKKIAVSGGSAQTLANATSTSGATWNRDGVIVLPLSLTSGLFRIPSGGGDPVPLARAGAPAAVVQQILPEFLPDGQHFLFSGLGSPDQRGIYAGSLDGTPAVRLIPDVLSDAAYVPASGAQGQAPGKDGYLLFRRGDALMAQRFNATRMSLSGEASTAAEKIGGTALWAAFSASDNGTLVYATGGANTVQLVWWDRNGKPVGLFGPPGNYDDFRLAPGEKSIVFSHVESNNSDVWVLDSARGMSSRLSSDQAIDDPPLWSPDGLRVVWASNRTGSFDLYIKSVNGGEPEKLLVKMGTPAGWPDDWSQDGRFLLYEVPGAKTGQDLWVAPQPAQGETGDQKPYAWLQTEFDERHGRFSPNGRWVAYTSNESGRDEVYVRSFPGSGEKVRISAGGGIEPQWRKDGTELFYIAEDRTLMAVPMKLTTSASEPLQVGTAKPLFSVPVVDTFIVGRSYEASGDGERFLLRTPVGGAAAPPLTVVLNWQTQLKQ